jgi:hypothetical protein
MSRDATHLLVMNADLIKPGGAAANRDFIFQTMRWEGYLPPPR